jgi:hypothetical protein
MHGKIADRFQRQLGDGLNIRFVLDAKDFFNSETILPSLG